jgi:hypothetical protein
MQVQPTRTRVNHLGDGQNRPSEVGEGIETVLVSILDVDIEDVSTAIAARRHADQRVRPTPPRSGGDRRVAARIIEAVRCERVFAP